MSETGPGLPSATSDAGFVAVLVIDLHFPDAGSLKAKRRELASLKGQLQARLHAAVSETAHHDRWQRATLTAALTAPMLRHLSDVADELERFVITRCPDGASVERIVRSVGDLRE